MTLRLEIILILMLHFGGIRLQIEDLFEIFGEDVLLSCNVDASFYQCSNVSWVYNRRGNTGLEILSTAKIVVQSSARTSRLSVSNNCSLLIKNITAEDAGQYVCRPGNSNKFDVPVYLNTLSSVSGQTEHLYHRVGDDVKLPCSDKSSFFSCSGVNWLYQRDSSAAFRTDVYFGNEQASSQASRLSLSSNCSLLIRNITDEDAGHYICRLGSRIELDTSVYLNTLNNLPGHNFIIMVGSVVKVVMFLIMVAALVYVCKRRTKGDKHQRGRTGRRPVDGDEDIL
ncbi:vascular endothelial growth factor receptor 1 [Oryzias melastigma]|uniref:vascular endothelial growth factor receptor 1 n=1 Tax=Oryzias melastigma TaxID=30732 RepID=UPI000CF7CC89|nr:vascular endothelial growth factor receptor 1 [Oryzias melastigma]